MNRRGFLTMMSGAAAAIAGSLTYRKLTDEPAPQPPQFVPQVTEADFDPDGLWHTPQQAWLTTQPDMKLTIQTTNGGQLEVDSDDGHEIILRNPKTGRELRL